MELALGVEVGVKTTGSGVNVWVGVGEGTGNVWMISKRRSPALLTSRMIFMANMLERFTPAKLPANGKSMVCGPLTTTVWLDDAECAKLSTSVTVTGYGTDDASDDCTIIRMPVTDEKFAPNPEPPAS